MSFVRLFIALLFSVQTSVQQSKDAVELTFHEDFMDMRLYLAFPLDVLNPDWIVEAELLRIQILDYIGAREIEVPTVTIVDEYTLSVVAFDSICQQIQQLLYTEELELRTSGDSKVVVDEAIIGPAKPIQILVLRLHNIELEPHAATLETEHLTQQIAEQLFIEEHKIYDAYVPPTRDEVYLVMERNTAITASVNLLATTLRLRTREGDRLEVVSYATTEFTPWLEERLLKYRHISPQIAPSPRTNPPIDPRIPVDALPSIVKRPEPISSRQLELLGGQTFAQPVKPFERLPIPAKTTTTTTTTTEKPLPTVRVISATKAPNTIVRRLPQINLNDLPDNPPIVDDTGRLLQAATYFSGNLHGSQYLELSLFSREKFGKAAVPKALRPKAQEEDKMKSQIAFALGISGEEIASLEIFPSPSDGPKLVVVGTADVILTLNRVLRDGRLFLTFSSGQQLRLKSTSINKAERLMEILLDCAKMEFNKHEFIYEIQAFRFHLEDQLGIPREDIEHILISQTPTYTKIARNKVRIPQWITFILTRAAAIKLLKGIRDGTFVLTTEYNERVIINYVFAREIRPITRRAIEKWTGLYGPLRGPKPAIRPVIGPQAKETFDGFKPVDALAPQGLNLAPGRFDQQLPNDGNRPFGGNIKSVLSSALGGALGGLGGAGGGGLAGLGLGDAAGGSLRESKFGSIDIPASGQPDFLNVGRGSSGFDLEPLDPAEQDLFSNGRFVGNPDGETPSQFAGTFNDNNNVKRRKNNRQRNKGRNKQTSGRASGASPNKQTSRRASGASPNKQTSRRASGTGRTGAMSFGKGAINVGTNSAGAPRSIFRNSGS